MLKAAQNCLFCKGRLNTFKSGIYDTRFGVQGSFNIYKCNACGLVQLIERLTGSELKSLYETYYNFGGNIKSVYTKFRKKFFESKIYRIWMAIDGDICFHSQRGEGRLLDVGCNEGQGLKIYKRNGFRAEGLEINVRAAADARKRGFHVSTNSFEMFYPEKPYDVVVLSHVIEHSVNPKEMLKHVSRILKPNGKVLISCPNVESWQRDTFRRYWINWHVPFHSTFFSTTTLKSLLNNTGFEVIKIKYVTPSLWVAQSIIAVLFAKKGRRNYTQRSTILLGSLMLFIRFIFFPLLWLGNLLGRGDCLIIEAKKKQAI
jgi:2-polyprenyl-3-methyl-5-hydroxy-6-metoxy-1,4-benzoquinol methylase